MKRNPDFHVILKEMGELHDRKNADYGSGEDPLSNFRMCEGWGIPAWVGALIRAGDKVSRLQTFYKKRKLRNESAEDSLRDLCVYAVLAHELFREQKVIDEIKEMNRVAKAASKRKSVVPKAQAVRPSTRRTPRN